MVDTYCRDVCFLYVHARNIIWDIYPFQSCELQIIATYNIAYTVKVTCVVDSEQFA